MNKKLKRAFHKMAFLPSGEFSMSRLLMVFSVVQVFAVLWVAIIAFLGWGKELPLAIYSFAGGMFGASGFQYGYTKHIHDRQESRACVPTEEPPPGAV